MAFLGGSYNTVVLQNLGNERKFVRVWFRESFTSSTCEYWKHSPSRVSSWRFLNIFRAAVWRSIFEPLIIYQINFPACVCPGGMIKVSKNRCRGELVIHLVRTQNFRKSCNFLPHDFLSGDKKYGSFRKNLILHMY